MAVRLDERQPPSLEVLSEWPVLSACYTERMTSVSQEVDGLTSDPRCFAVLRLNNEAFWNGLAAAMLSAFTARPIIELKQRDKSKIESILAYGDRILVGLNTGSLRVYRLNDGSPSSPTEAPTRPTNGHAALVSTLASAHVADAAHLSKPESAPIAAANHDVQAQAWSASVRAPGAKPTDLLREVEKFSSRAIEQLAIIKEANMLVSLSNYAVSLHDLQTFKPVEAPLGRSKNASAFAVTSNIVKDSATGIPEIISRLAVAVKRRLLLWSWHESELSPEVTEIVLTEAIRTITWANATRVVCGMNSGYVMVDVVTQTVEDIVGPGAIGGAAGGQGRFGAVSSAGMGYMGLGGYIPKPLSAKLADGELLLAKDVNTLFIDDSGKAIERRQIPWTTAPESVGYSYPYILALQAPSKGSLEVRNPDTLDLLQTIPLHGALGLHFPPSTVSLAHAGKGFHVLSERVVWKMDATDYDSQIDELVKAACFDEAISILHMLEDALLKNKTETLREIKMLKAELLFRQKKYRESMDLFNEDEVHAPPERVLRLFPRIIAGDLSGLPDQGKEEAGHEHAKGKTNGEKESKGDGHPDSTATQIGGTITKYLMGHRKPNSDASSVVPSKKTSEDDAASFRDKSSEDSTMEDKDLMAAVSELNSYLAGTRARLQRTIDPATGKLKPQMSRTGSTEEDFNNLLPSLRQQSDDKLESELKNTFKIVDTTLFRAYMYSRPALASSLFRIPNFCDPDVVHERLVDHDRFNELVDFFYGKKLHRQALELLRKYGSSDEPDPAAPTLHGPHRTVIYLQTLPPAMIDLILEFSEWTLRKDAKVAMDVFLADSENAETLPRDRVVKFLSGIDTTLEVQYLEHILIELNDGTPEFHNRLVELMVDQLKVKPRDDDWDELMERFVRFLKEGQYGLSRAFGMIPRDDPAFFEAQAVVLSNMGQHKQALEIYVFKMLDYAKAEDYCNRIFKAQECKSRPASPSQTRGSSADDAEHSDEETSIYHTLLSLYLTPPSPHPPSLEPALELLSRHGSRLPATSTLSLIPDTLSVTALESYFQGRMRSNNSVMNETRVVAGLRNVELVAAHALLALGDGIPGGQGGRNRRILVREDRVCGVCHKRLGGSVVAVMPDNSVVHYGCWNRTQSNAGLGGSPPTLLRNNRWGASSSSWGRNSAGTGSAGNI